MSYNYTIKAGNQRTIQVSCMAGDNDFFDDDLLLNATTRTLRIQNVDTEVVIEKTATHVSPSKLRATLLSADTAVAGEYTVEWYVLFADGTEITFPNGGYDTLRIVPALE